MDLPGTVDRWGSRGIPTAKKGHTVGLPLMETKASKAAPLREGMVSQEVTLLNQDLMLLSKVVTQPLSILNNQTTS
jgi:hypothetical protein